MKNTKYVLFTVLGIAIITSGFLFSKTLKATPSEVRLSKDDPILAYRVPEKPPRMFSEHDNRGGSIDYTVEEYVQRNPEVRDMEHIKAAYVYNLWNKTMKGRMWHEAVLYGFENGRIKDKTVAYNTCDLMAKVWDGENGEYKTMDYPLFIQRLRAYANLIELKLSGKSIIGYEYISYYFKHHRSKGDSLRWPVQRFHVELSKAMNGNLEKEQGKYSGYIKTFQPRMKQYASETGIGVSESRFESDIKYSVLSQEEGLIRIDFPVAKKAFLSYYNNAAIQKPPPYIFDLYNYKIQKNKEQAIKYNSIKSNPKWAHLSFEEEKAKIDEIFKYDKLEFLRSEPRVSINYAFVRPSGITDNPNFSSALLHYVGRARYSRNGELEDIIGGIVRPHSDCFLKRRGPQKVAEFTIEKPYFIKHPWKQIKSCKPYLKWFECHKMKRTFHGNYCDNVPPKEPRMCSK